MTNLPHIILIGDSIRMGYQEAVARELEGQAQVWAPEPNGGDSRNVLAHLDEWVLSREPDLVHLSCGLHDLKRAFGEEPNIPLEEYGANVRQILTRLQHELAGVVVWAATTPVDEALHHQNKGFDRFEADVEAYNEVARVVAVELGLPIDDLFAVVAREGKTQLLKQDGVHFTDAGSALLGRAVADCAREYLPKGQQMDAAVAELEAARQERAQQIAQAGGMAQALTAQALGRRIDTTVSEALVMGLLLQSVKTFFCVFGHGSTEIGEVLRIYQDQGLLRVLGVRSEIEASHAATALRWVTGEKAAVVTSIGPGALQALAAAIAPRSDGLGVWYLLGDETTEDEGPNMQQVPGSEQNAFLRLFGAMGRTYSLHTPQALPTALRRGLNTVDHPHQAGPFFLLLPLNIQPALLPQLNLRELPLGAPPPLGPAADGGRYRRAAEAIAAAERVVVKAGGGARGAGRELDEFLELADAVAVTSPLVSGVLPYDHPRNMTVGGSKGSICGNYAMEEADLLVAMGSRFVCQADSSRTGYPRVKTVVNINADAEAATHYGETMALVGDAAQTLTMLNQALKEHSRDGETPSPWFVACSEKKRAWAAFKAERYQHPVLHDEVWQEEVLTQPAAIKAVTDWARANDAVCFFDAGDVQANGFQVVEDDRLGRTFTETGASYMGFAVSALLATAVAEEPFYGLAISGDGSFAMNPQILIDGVEHGAMGCIVLLDNRRMGAISGLQLAQYGAECGTRDRVVVDYVAWARAVQGVAAFEGGNSAEALGQALDRARAYEGLALIHVPVYFGADERGALGAFGRWNVGNWCADTQALRHEIGL